MYFDTRNLCNKKVFMVSSVKIVFFETMTFFVKIKAKNLHITVEFYGGYGENEIIFFIRINNLIISSYIFILFHFYIYLAFLWRKRNWKQYEYFGLI